MAYPRPVLPADEATKVRDMRTIDVPLTASKIFTLLGVWGLAAVAALFIPRLLGLAPAETFSRAWWLAMVIRAPFFLLGGFAIHGLGVLMHEAAHWNLFPKKFWNDLAGIVISLPIGLIVTGYRVVHMLHHAEERSADDPDELENLKPSWFRLMVFYTWLFVGMEGYVIFVFFTSLFKARNWSQRLYVAFNYALMIGVWSTAIALAVRGGWVPTLLTVWVGPTFAATLVANVRGLAEHTMTFREEGPYRATRTTVSHPLVSWFMNNGNYHLEHHLFPDVAWHRLPELHTMMRPRLEQERAQLSRGYLAYLKAAFTVGPLGRVESTLADRWPRRIDRPIVAAPAGASSAAGAQPA
ncbi:MAG TPA: fatty acid desaturase [Myxococcota bacterium]|jgi:fatty acid desaturase|nr:fatty acid desaturase [Myxococcota bacterium]